MNMKIDHLFRVFFFVVVDQTEGNFLHDRFKSVQKQNFIETRVQAKYRNQIFVHRNISIGFSFPRPTKTKMKRDEKRSVREVGQENKEEFLFHLFI